MTSQLISKHIVVFGPGYTGRAIAARATQLGALVTLVGRDTAPLDVERALDRATHVLSTVAPHAGEDPVLASYGDRIDPSRLRWLGYLSTTGVYGDTGGALVDETAPVRSNVVRSKTRIAVEQQWQAKGAVHLFRLAGIYGPERNALARVKAGTAKRIFKPGHVVSRIHIDDIVRIVMDSMNAPDHGGTIYNLCDDEAVSPQEVIEFASRLLNMAPPASIALEAADLSPMAASFYQETRRVDNAKVRARFGQMIYPSFRNGLQALLPTV